MIKTTKEIWFSYDLDGKNEGYPYKNTLWVSLDEIHKTIEDMRECAEVDACDWIIDRLLEFFHSKSASALPRFPIADRRAVARPFMSGGLV